MTRNRAAFAAPTAAVAAFLVAALKVARFRAAVAAVLVPALKVAAFRAALPAFLLTASVTTAPLYAADEPASAAQVSGASVFAARCAVCHGAEAAGIPGTFPSLHEQVVAFAKTPEGRDYLVMVVTTGLMGDLLVGGVPYHNVMPAQSGLSEAEVAAVLSYLGSDRGRDASATALTAADVAAARARHPDKSAQSTRALRPASQS